MSNEQFKPYQSQFGWRMNVPPNFVPSPLTAKKEDYLLFGSVAAVRFILPTGEALLCWDLLPGAPVVEEVMCRFLYVLEKGNPVDIEVLDRVLAPIAPPPGSVSGAAVVELADGSPAMEILESFDMAGTPMKSYQLLFAWPENRYWPAGSMMTTMQAYCDPYERGVIFAHREEFAGYRNFRAEAITVGEPERLQRISFSAPADVFDKLLPDIRESGISFQMTRKPPAPWRELETRGPTARQALDRLKPLRAGPGSRPAR